MDNRKILIIAVVVIAAAAIIYLSKKGIISGRQGRALVNDEIKTE